MAENPDSKQCLVLSQNKSLIEEISKCSLSVATVQTASELLARAWSMSTEMLVLDGTGCKAEALVEQVQKLRDANGQTFICVFGEDAGRDPRTRIAVGDCGAAMTSWSVDAVRKAGEKVHSTLECVKGAKTYACPYCKKSGLGEFGLWLHCPLYHINEDKVRANCPICGQLPEDNVRRHIQKCHTPAAHADLLAGEHDDAIAAYAFGLVVCQRADGKLLLVQEKTGSGFWVPGGRINPGEGLIAGAKREALEEAGVKIKVTGLLKLEYLPHSSSNGAYVRVRAVFMAELEDPDQDIKSLPDYESVGAAWVSLAEMKAGLRLRNPEPLQWAEYLSKGKPVHPLSILDSP